MICVKKNHLGLSTLYATLYFLLNFWHSIVVTSIRPCWIFHENQGERTEKKMCHFFVVDFRQIILKRDG